MRAARACPLDWTARARWEFQRAVHRELTSYHRDDWAWRTQSLILNAYQGA
jgi:hypothetical protein